MTVVKKEINTVFFVTNWVVFIVRFKNDAYLSQSGQLYGEAGAMAYGKIFTFGPTFRAETF